MYLCFLYFGKSTRNSCNFGEPPCKVEHLIGSLTYWGFFNLLSNFATFQLSNAKKLFFASKYDNFHLKHIQPIKWYLNLKFLQLKFYQSSITSLKDTWPQ